MMKRSNRGARRGFTLVEMLVSVALVCLMLALFGEVFSIATKSMSKMKGVAENDQKARMLNTLIRNDLYAMSYQQVVGEQGIRALDQIDIDTNHKNISSLVTANTLGYFFIAENSPNDSTDDVIQFTIDAGRPLPLGSTGSNITDFGMDTIYGRALQFGTDNTPLADGVARDALQHNPDQPVFDDQAGRYSTGVLTSDQTGSSQYAEVAYFLRNGNLYRRQLLIRKPVVPKGKSDDQPMRGDGSNTSLLPSNTIYSAGLVWNPSSPAGTDTTLSTGSFWGDFDYSATWNGGLKFLGTVGGAIAPAPGTPFSLSLPHNRFGFLPSFGTSPFTSRSIDFTADGNFTGRYTQAETSDPAFGWPGNPGFGADSQPYTVDDTNPLTSPKTTLVNGVAAINGTNYNGTRVSQDLLLSGVHEFDITVWDPASSNPLGLQGEFVNIGGAGAAWFAAPNGTMAPNYGSGSANGTLWSNVFDTWTTQNTSVGGGAPFRFPQTQFGPDGQPGVAGVDDNGNGIFDQADYDPIAKEYREQGWMGSDDLLYLRAIKIHIRYYDVPSNSMRDLTILHSFVE
jgi:prepilin-type N-terminal cleavage/methylation domain-containing protein